VKLPSRDDPQPFERKKLNVAVRFFLWWVEYFVRVVGMAVLGVVLVLVGLWPRRSGTRKVFNILGLVASEFEARCERRDKDGRRG
jgi:hypothetical protein